MDKVFDWKWKKLVLSGGGPKGLAILGALHYIYENGGLIDIEEYWGTSIGSVLCVLLILGYTPFDAFHKFFMIQNITEPTLDIKKILEASGLCPIEVFGDKIRYLIEEKLGKNIEPTFEDLYKTTGKKLNIIGANATTLEGEIFNIENTPDMKIIDAIEISCDLPLIFTKKHYNGHIYVDGGFYNNYPINLADNGIDRVLGICVQGTLTQSTDAISWIYRILYMPALELYRLHLKYLTDKCTNLELIIDNINIIEVAPDQKKKIDLFSAGYKQGKQFLTEMIDEKLYINKIISNATHTDVHTDSNNDWNTDFDWDT